MKLTFEQWLTNVNRHLINMVGLEIDDLPDYCYRDAYEYNESPASVARKVIKEAL